MNMFIAPTIAVCPRAMAEYGGYAFDFYDPLPEECPCPVCHEVQKEPHQVTCCGKIFCKSCLDVLIKKRSVCPNCRKNFIRGKKYFPDVNTERKIKHLRVRCENSKRGCKWVGHLKDMNQTHIPNCPNHLIPCTNKKRKRTNTWMMFFSPNCGVLVQRKDHLLHMTQHCEWREAACINCSLKGSHNFIHGDHINECPDALVHCENESCPEKVKRKLLQVHCMSCPKQIITCRYSSVGCDKKIKREDVQSHNKECMEEHLDKAVEKLEKTITRMEILEAKASNWGKEEKKKCHTESDSQDDSDQSNDQELNYLRGYCHNCNHWHHKNDNCRYDGSD